MISDDISLNHSRMRPSLNKWYHVGNFHLYNIITTIIKECRVSFSREDHFNLRLVYSNPLVTNRLYTDTRASIRV